ncbi:unnamed protein product [Peniophora sp. CBMAI 1063]|nr:unnamed protein product [Peniophora sp. CBMAI 1063]
MIVLDDESLVDPSIRKEPTTPPATSAYESAQPLRDQAAAGPQEPQPDEPLLSGQSSQPLGPPPAYPGYQSTGYQSFPEPPPPPPAHEYDEREPAGPRFIKAFIVAILIYALAGSIAGSIVSSSYPAPRHGHQPWRVETWEDLFPADSAVKSAMCADSTSWILAPDYVPGDRFPHAAKLATSFELSLGSLDVFMMTGPGIQGNVTFNDDDTLRDTARVTVAARMDDAGWSALERTSVCKRSLNSMSNGVYILSDASDSLLQSLYLDVVVSMPTNPRPRALNIPELMVGMASMNLNMKFSAPYVFGSVAIRANHGNIHIDALVADDITLKTLNSAITGHYTAKRMFNLRATNEPVDIHVALSGGKPDGHPAEIVLGNMNAPVNAGISLHSETDDRTGNYRVVATTTKAPLNLEYRRVPVNAKLDAYMRTTEAPIHARLDSAFEGSFQLMNINAGDVVIDNSTIHNGDAGSRRHREVEWRTAGLRGRDRVTQGVAHWSPSLRPVDTMGSIACATTNHEIELLL